MKVKGDARSECAVLTLEVYAVRSNGSRRLIALRHGHGRQHLVLDEDGSNACPNRFFHCDFQFVGKKALKR